MKKLTRADKAIRFGTLALMLGLGLPPACSDDDVMQSPVDGTSSGGKGGVGGTAGAVGPRDGAPRGDGAQRIGGRGGSGGNSGKGGSAGLPGVIGDGAMSWIVDGSNRIDDAGADDAGQ